GLCEGLRSPAAPGPLGRHDPDRPHPGAATRHPDGAHGVRAAGRPHARPQRTVLPAQLPTGDRSRDLVPGRGGALAEGAGAPQADGGGARGSAVIVDSHCHAGKGDGLTGPWDTSAALGAYLRRADRAGIERTVLFSVFHSDYAEANRAVGRIALRRPDRFLAFAFVHALRDRGRVLALVTEAVERYGMCGIKVHRHDAPISREICETARALRLPVLYD